MTYYIVNRVYLLACDIQDLHPEYSWIRCCEYAFQQNLEDVRLRRV